MRKFQMAIFLGMLFIGSIACNLPTRRNPNLPTTEAVYTQSAATIIAQLTDIYEGDFPLETTPTPGETSLAATHTPTPSLTIATPTATVTPVPSTTVTATMTAMPTGEDPRQLLGEPDWVDNFRNDFSWAPYEDEHVRFQLRENQMLMQAKIAEGWDAWMLATPKMDDYYLEMTAQTQTCEGLDRYGLIIRSDALTGYLFGLSCDGEYSFRKWDGEEFTSLVDWTSSPAIVAGEGQTNRLGVMAEGNQYQLYANGILLETVTDETFDEDGFGMFVAADSTENFTTSVSEVAYWMLE